MLLRSKIFSILILSFILGIISINSHSQTKSSGEIGVALGGSYYLGELNKKPFVGTKISAGAFYRHTFDTRYSIVGKFTYGKLTGDASNTNLNYPAIETFNKPFYELSGLCEYNFIPFLPGNKKYIYSPYVFAGIAVAYYKRESLPIIINIPFGMGLKYNLNTNFILGAFIGMHKTFIDNIDYDYYPKPTTAEPIKQWSYDGNKDWYSVFGVTLSYKIKYSMKCPAFD